MNEMQIFENSEFGKIRTAVTPENPLFCLADLCKALEIGNPSDVKNRLDDGVVSIEVISDSIGRKQQMIFVNEDGLYDVILDSRKPEAKRFRKWITSEVLPSIRKTGSYSISSQMKGDEVQIIGKMAADIQSLFAVKRGIALSKAIELVSVNNNLNLEELKKLLPPADMEIKNCIDGLNDLIRDRKSFLTEEEDHDKIFISDIHCLKKAINILKKYNGV